MSTTPYRVTTRGELIALLAEAAELEHSLVCQYLYMAFSLKQSTTEGVTSTQLARIRGWSNTIIEKVAVQEMLHMALVCNLLTAIGGAPYLLRPNFPQVRKYFALGIESILTPFSEEALGRYMCWEQPEWPGWWNDFCAKRGAQRGVETHAFIELLHALNPSDPRYGTIAELYGLIEAAVRAMPPEKLFIGPRAAQASNAYLPFDPPLIVVFDADSAVRAIELIVREGEGTRSQHDTIPGEPSDDCHFAYFRDIRKEFLEELSRDPQFQPARPVIDNPLFDFQRATASPGANIITDPLARSVGQIFTATYDLMVQMLMRFFAHVGETEEQLTTLANAFTGIMGGVIAPLGMALTRLPAGPRYPGKNAGPSFELYRGIQPLPHRYPTWRYFRERLGEIADECAQLSMDAGAPEELTGAGALLEMWGELFSPLVGEGI